MNTSIIAVLANDKNSEAYKEPGKYTFPSYENVDPAEKDSADYCMSIARAAYSTLMRDRSYLPTDYYNYIQTLRDYGSGNQSTTFYSNLLKEADPGVTQTGERTTLDEYDKREAKRRADDNINHKIMSISTSLKQSIHGIIDQYEEDVYCNSIDNESGDEEERMMYEALFDTRMAEFTKQMQDTYGIPIHQETGMPGDVSLNELETYKETGGFKTAWAESMEEAVQWTEQYSKWDDVLKRKFVDDAVDINFMVGRVLHESSSAYEKWEYVDPANFAIQYSQENNFNDAEYAGYFKLEKIGKLVEKGFDSDDLVEAARNYEYLWDNPTDVDWGAYNRTRILSSKLYDFKVPVFHFQWIDVNVKRGLKITNKYNKTFLHDLGFDEEIKELSDYKKRNGMSQEEQKTRVRKAYQVSWVVNTDMAYDFGPIPNQPRKSKREAKLSYVVWRGVTTNRKMIFGSLIESIVPLLDHLQLAWLKYQNNLVKSHPGGYAVELRLLQNLKIGGELIDPLEAYKMFWNKNVLPYMSSPIGGERYSGGPVMPITRIEGTQGELMNVIQAEISFVIQMIERITGVAPAAMGVSPDADQPVANTQMALQGTNNVLKPYINGIFEIKEGLAFETSRRLPILFRNVKTSKEAYGRIIGPKSVEVITEAEHHGAEYGLYMEARPDGQDKQDLIVMIQEAMKRGRDGEASVNIGQGMYIIERVKSGGNFKKLQRQVDMMIRKSEQEAFEKKRALIAEQNQQQATIEQAKQQAMMQAKQMDTQSDMMKDNNKSKNNIRETQVEKNMDYRALIMKERMDLIQKKHESEAAMQRLQYDKNMEYRETIARERIELLGKKAESDLQEQQLMREMAEPKV